MDYSNMISAVSAEINLGTKFDAEIPDKLRQAIRNFETRLTFPYMRVEIPVELSEGEQEILLIDALENKSANYTINQVKKIDYLRFPSVAGPNPEWHYVRKIDATDVAEVDTENLLPNGYWLKGNNSLQLDRGSDQDYIYNAITALDNSIKMGTVLFTDFNRVINVTQNDAWDSTQECQEEFIAERWLLANAERALFLRTCMNFASRIRDAKLLQMWAFDLYGNPKDDSTQAEWDILVQSVEEIDATNEAVYMNPDYDKASR